jgi:hypothetical protein
MSAPRAALLGRARIAGARADRGAVTMFLAVAVVGLMALAGLVVDGAAKVRAAQRADRVAAEAARAAGQAIDLTAALGGEAVRVDRRAALAAAAQYLRDAGVEGRASVSADGAAITVTTHSSAPTVFLGLVGVPEVDARGRAEARLVHSERGEQP